MEISEIVEKTHETYWKWFTIISLCPGRNLGLGGVAGF